MNPVLFFCVVLCAPVTSASLFVSLKAPAPDLSVAGLQGAMGGFFQTAGGWGGSLFKSPTHSSKSDCDEPLFSESVTAALYPGAEWATQQTQQWTFSSRHVGALRYIIKSVR